MSSVSAIREALASTIEAGVESEIFTYDTVPDVAQLPAVVVIPDKADFSGAFNRGLDEWTFNVYVLVNRTDADTNQDQLDSFITGAGPDSIRQALYNTPNLGLLNTDAFPRGVDGYGGEFKTARIQHTGAILKVVVRTDGAN